MGSSPARSARSIAPAGDALTVAIMSNVATIGDPIICDPADGGNLNLALAAALTSATAAAPEAQDGRHVILLAGPADDLTVDQFIWSWQELYWRWSKSFAGKAVRIWVELPVAGAVAAAVVVVGDDSTCVAGIVTVDDAPVCPPASPVTAGALREWAHTAIVAPPPEPPPLPDVVTDVVTSDGTTVSIEVNTALREASVYLEQSEIGYLWWQPDGEIQKIETSSDFQRRGVATAMWNTVSALVPSLHHSDDRSPEGELWARAVGGPGL